MSGTWGWYFERLLAAAEKYRQHCGVGNAEDGFHEFVFGAFNSLLEEELRRYQPEALAPCLVLFHDFVERQSRRRLGVRLYTPRLEQEGWTSGTTIIEVLGEETPFLLNTVKLALSRHSMKPLLVIDYSLPDDERNIYRVALHIEVRAVSFAEEEAMLVELESLLNMLGRVVDDHGRMRDALLRESMMALRLAESGVRKQENMELYAFISWILQENLLLLGMSEWVYQGSERIFRPGSGLGLAALKDVDMLPEQALFGSAHGHELVAFAKSKDRSSINHDAFCDVVAIKRQDEYGGQVGELRMQGLYTSRMQQSDPSTIPVLREKLAVIRNICGFHQLSSDSRNLERLLRFYPCDELLLGDAEEFARVFKPIVRKENPRDAKFVWRGDPYQRFLCVNVFLPKSLYDKSVVSRFADVLRQEWGAEDAEISTFVSEYLWVRLEFDFLTQVRPGDEEKAKLERVFAYLALSWDLAFLEELKTKYGDDEAAGLYARYRNMMPDGYREAFRPPEACNDVRSLQGISYENPISVAVYDLDKTHSALRFKVFHWQDQMLLSDLMPVLESFGLKIIEERPFALQYEGDCIWVHDFSAKLASSVHYEAFDGVFQEAVIACWREQCEVDGFNRLVIGCLLDWRSTMVLRAYGRYQKQLGVQNSIEAMAQALCSNMPVAVDLFGLFKDRLLPSTSSEERVKRIKARLIYLEAGIGRAKTLSEDTILRRYLELVMATTRSNFYVEGRREYLSFKVNCREVTFMPQPRPRCEIFVYSSRFEGVHLRQGSVARGGLRWSDRPDDYRTEILGLVKAQQVKNSVIVPLGAKGGFILRRQQELSGNLPLLRQEALEVYKLYLHGLLDLTDNLVSGKVVHPKNVVCHDGDDPYLVVAADKGTATFSDTANSVSAEYAFWLGDAFASGGSQGYDHKRMGITARGAFVSLIRHLRRFNIDPQHQPFSCIGIGDMSGDVFGNGMLLSNKMRLLAAFNHAHIFIDPDPDPEKSHGERLRLFQLPTSNWSDYSQDKLSKGGGVYSRQEKSITPSAEARAALGLPVGGLTPDQLINALLRAPVDVIWNGGIGTYVKSSSERQSDAGDRANDGLRVNGGDIRARIFCEGGNLGMTQKGRIEYSLSGGLCNTDFIDNSAGVDCSDHEVNLKIFFSGLLRDGSITVNERNDLLMQMETEVRDLVLADNRAQAFILSVAASHQLGRYSEYWDFIAFLEKQANLDRTLEGLPNSTEWRERVRDKLWLTRPELAVLLAYAKNHLKMALADAKVADDEFCQEYLYAAFPSSMRERFGQQMPDHPLRHALVGTQIANDLINCLGVTSLQRLTQRQGVTLMDIVRAFLVVKSVFDLDELWEKVAEGIPGVSEENLLFVSDSIMKFSRLAVIWFAGEPHPAHHVGEIANQYRGVKALAGAHTDKLQLLHLLNASVDSWSKIPLPNDMARQIGMLEHSVAFLEICRVQIEHNASLEVVAAALEEVDHLMGFNELAERLRQLAVHNKWQAHAREGYLEKWRSLQRSVALFRLRGGVIVPDAEGMRHWHQLRNAVSVEDFREPSVFVALSERLESVVRELTLSGETTVSYVI